MSKEGDVARFYKRKQVESASPGQLVLLLYEGAIDYLNKAEQALGMDDTSRIERYHNSLIAAQNILTELTVSLDLEAGGDIADNLFKLYDYMNYRLIDANINKEIEPILEVKELLVSLHSAWVDVVKQEKPVGEVKQNTGLNLQG